MEGEDPGGLRFGRLGGHAAQLGAGSGSPVGSSSGSRPAAVFARGEVGADANRRRGERGCQDEPDHPEEATGADRDDEDDERVEPQGRPVGDRLEDVLQGAVGEDHDDEHD